VEADQHVFHGETMDVGPQGAKLRLAERLEVGTRVHLHLTPTQGRQVTIEAIVWRIDDDGLAFFFLSARSRPEKGEGGVDGGRIDHPILHAHGNDSCGG
jgi:hypothetical protein